MNGLAQRARGAGLAVLAAAGWPGDGDTEPPRLAGFIHSNFNPIVAAVADRCLAGLSPDAPAIPPETAIVLVTDLGDVDSAAHVAQAVDTGARVGPLFFFQSVPNAVLGHIAARHALSGPVSCVCDAASGVDAARGLLADGDADRVLLIELDRDETGESAAAVVVAHGGTS
ncbi:beta-ketoacyl synthase chain length factor [Dactylosporangium sp. CA-092794]|uniref:beta-ketoacyl synthase chain length factor n=1 Tax=Dactylosporangium sp. CA-092794 TaxID=3239929 RepID=UPI003D908CF0